MSHFDYDDFDRGMSEDILCDHPQFVRDEDGRIHDAITDEVVV